MVHWSKCFRPHSGMCRTARSLASPLCAGRARACPTVLGMNSPSVGGPCCDGTSTGEAVESTWMWLFLPWTCLLPPQEHETIVFSFPVSSTSMLMLQAERERRRYVSIFWLPHLGHGRGDALTSSSQLGSLIYIIMS